MNYNASMKIKHNENTDISKPQISWISQISPENIIVLCFQVISVKI